MPACWARVAAPQRSFVLNNSNKIAGAIAKIFTVHTVAVQLRKEMRGPVTKSDGQQTDFWSRESSACDIAIVSHGSSRDPSIACVPISAAHSSTLILINPSNEAIMHAVLV